MPSFLFYTPIKLFIQWKSERKRETNLAKSFIKIKGNDIVATVKIFYGFLIIQAFLIILFFAIEYNVSKFLSGSKAVGCLMTLGLNILIVSYLYMCLVTKEEVKKIFRILNR